MMNKMMDYLVIILFLALNYHLINSLILTSVENRESFNNLAEAMVTISPLNGHDGGMHQSKSSGESGLDTMAEESSGIMIKAKCSNCWYNI